MKIQKLNDGTLLVPKIIEENGVIGDRMIEIKITHDEYNKYLKQYKREQELELNEEE